MKYFEIAHGLIDDFCIFCYADKKDAAHDTLEEMKIFIELVRRKKKELQMDLGVLASLHSNDTSWEFFEMLKDGDYVAKLEDMKDALDRIEIFKENLSKEDF